MGKRSVGNDTLSLKGLSLYLVSFLIVSLIIIMDTGDDDDGEN